MGFLPNYMESGGVSGRVQTKQIAHELLFIGAGGWILEDSLCQSVIFVHIQNIS